MPKRESVSNYWLKNPTKSQTNTARGAFYSIICPSVDIIKDNKFNLVLNDLAVAFDLKNIPNTKYIPMLQSLHYAKKNGRVYAIPLAEGPATIYYNAKKVPEPKSYDLLWKKKYKTGITNLPTHVAVGVALGVGFDKKSTFGWDELSQNQKFLNAFSATIKNAKVISTGVFNASEIKDLDLYFGYGFANTESNQMFKTDFKLANIKEGHGIWRDHFMMTKRVYSSPLTKKITEEFINYLLSPENQRQLMATIGIEATNIKAYPLLSKKDLDLLPHLQNMSEYKKNGFILPSHSKRDRNGIVEYYKSHGGK